MDSWLVHAIHGLINDDESHQLFVSSFCSQSIKINFVVYNVTFLMGVFFILCLCLCRINYRRGQTIYGPNASVCLPSQTLAQGRSLGPVTQNYISSFIFFKYFLSICQEEFGGRSICLDFRKTRNFCNLPACASCYRGWHIEGRTGSFGSRGKICRWSRLN